MAGPVWGCLPACPVPVGGGVRHGYLWVSWEGCCCRPVSQVPDVSHSFILSPVVPSVDEVFGLFLLMSKEVSLEG